MILFLLHVLLSCAAGRVAAGLCFDERENAFDRLVCAIAWTLAFHQGVPLAVGAATGSVAIMASIAGDAALLALLAGVAWMTRNDGARRFDSLLVACVRAWMRSPLVARALWTMAFSILFLACLPGWFLPPRFSDAVDYHILQPMRMVDDGRFELAVREPQDLATPWWWGESYPNLKAMHVALWAQARGSWEGAGLIQGAYVFAWLVCLAAMGRMLRLPAWSTGVAAILLASAPDVLLEATELYSDMIGGASVAFAAWGILGLALSERPRRWIVPFAVALAHVPSAKALLYPATAALLVVASVVAWRRGGAALALRVAGAGIVAAALLSGAWTVRTLWLHGNPLYPIRIEIAGRVLFDGPAEMDVNTRGMGEDRIPEREMALRSPFETIGVTHMANRLGGGGPAFVGILVPAVVALLVGGRGAWRDGWGLLLVLLLCLFASIPDLWWPRYQFNLWTAMLLCAARMFRDGGRMARAYFGVVVATTVAWNAYRCVPAVQAFPRPPIQWAYPFVTGDRAPVALARASAVYDARDFVREEVLRDPDAVVAHVHFEFPDYWLDRADTPMTTVEMPTVEEAGGAAAWVKLLRESSATHFVAPCNWEEAYAIAEAGPDAGIRKLREDWYWPEESAWIGEQPRMAVWEIAR